MSKITRTHKKDNVIAEGITVWMGLDVHKKSVAIATLSDKQLVHRDSVTVDRRHFESLVERLPGCDIRAVYEAGPTGYQVLRWLRELGVDAMMTAASMVPVRPGASVKTDRRDALALARAHRAQMLDPIWDLTDEQYEHRELVRTRAQFVGDRSRTCIRIRSKLTFHGHPTPENDNWTKEFLSWLESDPTGRSGIDESLKAFVEQYRFLSRKILDIEAKIRRLAATTYKVEVDILTSIPGVGLITAMTVITEIGDIKRFGTAKKFASYLGLVPGERSTGERIRKTGLPRRGNAFIRTILIQAAWTLIKKDAGMRQMYERIKARNSKYGAQIAIVAVAHRLGLTVRAMLRDGTLYEFEEVVA